MLPDEELDLLLDAVEQAVEAAEAGRFSDGHLRLAAGLQRARQHARCGEPWGGELFGRYQFALQRYGEAYSVLRYWKPPVESID